MRTRELGDDPVVQRLAASLGATGQGDALQRIRNHVRARIDTLVEGWPIRSLDNLQLLVANELGVCLEAIRHDADLARIASTRRGFSPHLLRVLKDEFLRGRTEGLLLRHPEPRDGDLPFLAVIDMRGERAVRGYFTAWHELAHLLVVPRVDMAGAVHRNVEVGRKDPLEALVDDIAGLVGFYEPIFRPALGSDDTFAQLSITQLEQIRDQVAPRASLHATAVAAIRLAPGPMAFVCAKPERRGTASSLVIQSVTLSGAAVAATWNLVPNMVIDPRSCMTEVLRVANGLEIRQQETQAGWEHPRGMRCTPTRATIIAAQRGPVVYALLHGVSA